METEYFIRDAQPTLIVCDPREEPDLRAIAANAGGRVETLDHQGKGIGTHLLERLALLAARVGYTRFWAITHFDNRGMIDVFRHSGFPLTEKFDAGYLELDFSVVPTQSSVELSEMRDRVFTAASLRWLFKPAAVAVVGASREPSRLCRAIPYRSIFSIYSRSGLPLQR